MMAGRRVATNNRNHGKQMNGGGIQGMLSRLSIAVLVLIICTLSLYSTIKGTTTTTDSPTRSQISVDQLWDTAASHGWRPSSAPRSDWQPPPSESNGYLRVRCNGGLNQQRTAICNAVLAARIMNATLVLPELDANSFWHDDSGFKGIYDVDHFIKSLRYDVRIVESLPEIRSNGKTKKKMKAYQLRPPRDAPVSWYTTDALEKMKEHGAIYLTPFSHRLEEEIDNPEYQRLRCRVNYHALRFKPQIMKLSNLIVNKLRSQGHFMAIHLRFEMDMLAFAGCFDIFTPQEQKILRKYRKENFAEKSLVYSERRAIGKCPLTPEEVSSALGGMKLGGMSCSMNQVGLILRAMNFDNSTRIYIAAGELFGGERFMKPFRTLFPHLENHSTVGPSDELVENTRGLLGSAVDYMVCLLADIFMPTYDGPSNFANNVMGHRLYYGFRTIIQPDRKALAPIFIDRENGRTAGFEEAVRHVMQKTQFGGPHKRVRPESVFTNSWPECFCQTSPQNPADKCPPENVVEVLNSKMHGEETDGKETDGETVIGVNLCESSHNYILKSKTERLLLPYWAKQLQPSAPCRYKYSEVKKMTNSFKDTLGKGGYGCVFKGHLRDGRLVAVKVLNESKGNGEDFVNEVATIGRTNLSMWSAFLAFVPRKPKELVYEFMPNGSLERFIYKEKESSFAPLLGSEKIYLIALGIATETLEWSHKSDVYSYGMMVFEMIGGRKNINTKVENMSEIYFPQDVHGDAEEFALVSKCASFRLHAERAFKFSRNQMQDSREVALGLMKELSRVRSLLAKSIDGSDGRAMVEVAQVKVACQKALRAEDLAKSCLREMNEELNIHCKAPGHFIAIHLRFEMDMLAFAGCFDIFTPQAQKILRKYRKENFAEISLVYS
ncbi:hypothetical protein IFM89_023639 [Coptis chinensis]|uniref:O-fucosyltransferase family protein n=1 Tax=Coptis chinensis TaxID=261450 RepID=A0A835HWS6_9MAGN|nr:hypothetical protein IFM89_023639 [Coptis chinensis]